MQVGVAKLCKEARGERELMRKSRVKYHTLILSSPSSQGNENSASTPHCIIRRLTTYRRDRLSLYVSSLALQHYSISSFKKLAYTQQASLGH